MPSTRGGARFRGIMWRPAASWVLVCLWLGLGCQSGTEESVLCRTDSDCPKGERCHLPDPPKEIAYGMAPCFEHTACTADSDCGAGEICAPNWQIETVVPNGCPPRLCGRPCEVSGCPSDSRCETGGLCALIPCDAKDAEACPNHWLCDPEAAPDTNVNGQGAWSSDAVDPKRAIERGCARLPCDQPNGVTCEPYWHCDPSESEDGSGCVPTDCAESGRCLDEMYQICASQTDLAHPGQTPDMFGCFERTCEEGYSCEHLLDNGKDVAGCDVGNPAADIYGCYLKPCETNEDCDRSSACQPDSPDADARGCKLLHCARGELECPEGTFCDPKTTESIDGCVEGEPPTGIGGGSSIDVGGSAGNAGMGEAKLLYGICEVK